MMDKEIIRKHTDKISNLETELLFEIVETGREIGKEENMDFAQSLAMTYKLFIVVIYDMLKTWIEAENETVKELGGGNNE